MNFRNQVEKFVELTIDVLYPIRQAKKAEESIDNSSIRVALQSILEDNLADSEVASALTLKKFMEGLAEIKELLDKDVQALYDGDPAAETLIEIIIAYPGFQAIASYRIAHLLYKLDVPLIPRIITENSHAYTGIDIHPAARIGESICIDHGTGVVIGQTCEIGNNVKIYQGVTLGALSIPKEKTNKKRHPTIEDHVIIYAQATILGGETVIGANSIIGGNVWITSSIPPNSKVIYDATYALKPITNNTSN